MDAIFSLFYFFLSLSSMQSFSASHFSSFLKRLRRSFSSLSFGPSGACWFSESKNQPAFVHQQPHLISIAPSWILQSKKCLLFSLFSLSDLTTSLSVCFSAFSSLLPFVFLSLCVVWLSVSFSLDLSPRLSLHNQRERKRGRHTLCRLFLSFFLSLFLSLFLSRRFWAPLTSSLLYLVWQLDSSATGVG